METLEERAKMQLLAVEMAYNIKINNKEEIARLIAANTVDKRAALRVCSSINSWIATSNEISGTVTVPIDMVDQVIKALK